MRAAQAAGLETIPAIVRASDDRESLEVAIIENLQRENLDALEEAMGFQHLMEAHDFTQEQVAERVGKSRPSIANALRLLSLSDTIKQYVRDGKLTAGHARAILSLPPERREAAARRAVDEQLSVRALEQLAHGAAPKRARTTAPAALRASGDDEAFVERLRYKYATNVRVVRQERGGAVELRFADAADLDPDRRPAAGRTIVKLAGRGACALLCATLLGTSPAPAPRPSYGPVPNNAQTARRQTLRRRVARPRVSTTRSRSSPTKSVRTSAARPRSRACSTPTVTRLKKASIVGARGDDRGRVYFVREQIAFVDHADDSRREIDATVPIGVLPEHGALHVKDPGKPYRAFASESSVEASGLRATVKKVDFFPDRIDVVVTFTNVGDNFVTVLPYGKSVLRDDRGGVYRILATKDWTVTDKRLFQGIPLAPNSRYTGSLAFSSARLGDLKRNWSLTLAPALRDGADEPFELTIPIAPRS